jgi:GMP synthase-like glutamine amidotransferase
VHYLDPLPAAAAYVLSGSGAPWRLHDSSDLERVGEALRSCRRPVLGLCAGMQLQAMAAGGTVAPMKRRGAAPERGFLEVHLDDRGDLFRDLPERIVVRQDHEDEVTLLPPGFAVLASSPACAIQAVADRERDWWGTQFHPEWYSREHPLGRRVLEAFFRLAGVRAEAPRTRRDRRPPGRPHATKEESDAPR